MVAGALRGFQCPFASAAGLARSGQSVGSGTPGSGRAAPSSGPMRRGSEADGNSLVQARDSSASLLGKSPQALPGKVTDSGFSTARCLLAWAEVGSAAHNWSKISGENRAITTPSVVVQEQPCTLKVTASRSASPSPPPSGSDSRAVPGKISRASSPSPPSSRGARAVSGEYHRRRPQRPA